jgi:hypothetical protein
MKPELLALFLQFLKDHPKPTKKDLKQLLPQVNLGEKEVRDPAHSSLLLLLSMPVPLHCDAKASALPKDHRSTEEGEKG